MRYNLRTLVILLLVAPPLIAFTLAWFDTKYFWPAVVIIALNAFIGVLDRWLIRR